MAISSRSTFDQWKEVASVGSERPSNEELKLVARHGSGTIERALAVVELAKRQDRLDELLEVTEGR